MLLKISQEASNVAASSQQVSSTDLITNKRTISTKVMVEDGGIIVLGGLISDEATESKQQVPFLCSIPILGELFKTRGVRKTKTNLMVFIRPRILRDGIDAAIETNAKYNYIRDQQLDYHNGKVPLMPGERQPTLPALETLVPPELLNPARTASPPGNTPAQRAEAPRDPVTPSRRRGPHRRAETPPRQPTRSAAGSRVQYELQGRHDAVSTAATDEAILAATGRVTDPTRPLPFTFAKRHGVLVRARATPSADVVIRDGVSPQRSPRCAGICAVRSSSSASSAERFELLLREAYEGGSGSTRWTRWAGLEEETDLAQPRPGNPRALGPARERGRRADHPPDQRAADAGGQGERLATSTSSRSRTGSWCASASTACCAKCCSRTRRCAPLIVSRIKVMATLDIAEKRLPQDGRISLRIAGTRGRRARIDHSDRPRRARRAAPARQAGRPPRPRLARHGLRTRSGTIDELIHKPHGILLVTGPTGSGKTTTLYAALDRINDRSAQHHDGRGPDRVLHRRHRPDAGQHARSR